MEFCQEVLSSLKILHVKGKVFSGGGEGARFTELPWVKKQMAEKLGFIPYPGTLNIKLTEDKVNIKKLLKKAKAIEISPAPGFCRGKCFQAYLMGNLKCAIIIPEVENYPEDVIEVIAPVNLREKFKPKNGSVIEVRIVL